MVHTTQTGNPALTVSINKKPIKVQLLADARQNLSIILYLIVSVNTLNELQLTDFV